MTMATIQIPQKFEGGILTVKKWVETYSRAAGHPVTVAMGIQQAISEISIVEADNLNQEEIGALEHALFNLNNHLLNPISRLDPWKALTEAGKELEANHQATAEALKV